MTRTTTIFVCVGIAVSMLMAPMAEAGDTTPKPERVRDRAISKLEAWRPISAESILKKALEVEDSQPFRTAEGYLLAVAGVGRDEKMLAQGLQMLSTQSEKDPTDPVAAYYRGVALLWSDQKKEADAAWKKVEDRARALIAENSKDARAQYYLGVALVRQKKQSSDARKAFKKALSGGFNQAMIDFNVGLSYIVEGKWQPARKAFDSVHEVDPRFSHLYFYRGMAWDKLGRKDKLINDLDQFVKLAPNAPEAKTARAILSSVG